MSLQQAKIAVRFSERLFRIIGARLAISDGLLQRDGVSVGVEGFLRLSRGAEQQAEAVVGVRLASPQRLVVWRLGRELAEQTERLIAELDGVFAIADRLGDHRRLVVGACHFGGKFRISFGASDELPVVFERIVQQRTSQRLGAGQPGEFVGDAAEAIDHLPSLLIVLLGTQAIRFRRGEGFLRTPVALSNEDRRGCRDAGEQDQEGCRQGDDLAVPQRPLRRPINRRRPAGLGRFAVEEPPQIVGKRPRRGIALVAGLREGA